MVRLIHFPQSPGAWFSHFPQAPGARSARLAYAPFGAARGRALRAALQPGSRHKGLLVGCRCAGSTHPPPPAPLPPEGRRGDVVERAGVLFYSPSPPWGGEGRGEEGVVSFISLNRRAFAPLAWLTRHSARHAVARSGLLRSPVPITTNASSVARWGPRSMVRCTARGWRARIAS